MAWNLHILYQKIPWTNQSNIKSEHGIATQRQHIKKQTKKKEKYTCQEQTKIPWTTPSKNPMEPYTVIRPDIYPEYPVRLANIS